MNHQVINVTTFGDLLVHAAQQRPDKVAVAFTDVSATAPELLDRSVHMACGLHGLGVRRGDRVAIVMPNCVAERYSSSSSSIPRAIFARRLP